MHAFNLSKWQSLAVLALTAFPANAQKPLTKSYCTTALTSKSISPVRTQSTAITVTKTPIKHILSTPSTTITPAPSTTTSTVATVTTTTTTASQITETFTDISTELITVTVEAPTTTFTSTATASTDTTVTSTSTVPTPAGFIPIQTSVGKAPPSKRDTELLSPKSGSLIARANALRAVKNGGSCGKPLQQYPKKVSCLVKVTVFAPAKTITQTVRTTKTFTAPALTSTVTSTTTLEATSTFLPTPALTTVSTTTTISFVATTTPSTTTITTTTTTNTVYAPSTTYYAQCQNDNFIGTDGWGGSGSATENSVSGINSAYDCCTACAQQPGCEYSAYQDGGFGCLLLYNSQQTCTDTDQFVLNQDLNRYTASNGCVNAKYGSG